MEQHGRWKEVRQKCLEVGSNDSFAKAAARFDCQRPASFYVGMATMKFLLGLFTKMLGCALLQLFFSSFSSNNHGVLQLQRELVAEPGEVYCVLSLTSLPK